MRRYIPEPFALAMALTLLVMGVGLGRLVWMGGCGSEALRRVFEAWLGGLLNPGGLSFALQMCLVLVTGHALALSGPVQRGVKALSRLPQTTASAAALVALVGCVASVLHWGLGTIVGALLAREVARAAEAEGRVLSYPLLGAAAYAGFAVWHGGLSGSAPLSVATPGHFLEGSVGVIPASRTLFGGLNLVVTGVMVCVIVGLFWWLGRRAEVDPEQPRPPAWEASEEAPGGGQWVGVALGLGGLCVVSWGLWRGALEVNLGAVILGFLFLGMALQGGLSRYAAAASDGARGAGGIILQFPFYFGILGVMKATGLIGWISEGLTSLASAGTFPVVAFVSAGVVNLLVPSGGGQWAVQGEVLLKAGAELGVDPGVVVMAFAYGDAWTNMLQPFWALPLLGIMGLKARDVIGDTAKVFVALGLVIPLILLVM